MFCTIMGKRMIQFNTQEKCHCSQNRSPLNKYNYDTTRYRFFLLILLCLILIFFFGSRDLSTFYCIELPMCCAGIVNYTHIAPKCVLLLVLQPKKQNNRQNKQKRILLVLDTQCTVQWFVRSGFKH